MLEGPVQTASPQRGELAAGQGLLWLSWENRRPSCDVRSSQRVLVNPSNETVRTPTAAPADGSSMRKRALPERVCERVPQTGGAVRAIVGLVWASGLRAAETWPTAALLDAAPKIASAYYHHPALMRWVLHLTDLDVPAILVQQNEFASAIALLDSYWPAEWAETGWLAVFGGSFWYGRPDVSADVLGRVERGELHLGQPTLARMLLWAAQHRDVELLSRLLALKAPTWSITRQSAHRQLCLGNVVLRELHHAGVHLDQEALAYLLKYGVNDER